MTRIDRHHSADRLELLLFNLDGRQCFGINVLKVKEVVACPPLTQLPHHHPAVRGVAHLRGEPLTVIDMAQVVGRQTLYPDSRAARAGQLIVSEFNRNMQGFLVRQVDRIVLRDWKSVLPPPRSSGNAHFTTGVTEQEGRLVQILDVEQIIDQVIGHGGGPLPISDERSRMICQGRRVLVVDDSTIARNQSVATLEPFGIECLLARDGLEALQQLRQLAAAGGDALVDMVISDIEMPEMDGYTLTREIRDDPHLASLYVLLHTSLTGDISANRAAAVGANDFLTKFIPEALAQRMIEGMRQLPPRSSASAGI